MQTKAQHEAKLKVVWFGYYGKYTCIPNTFLVSAADWGLEPIHVLIVVHLLMHKWTREHPYPSVATLMRGIGRSRRVIQNAIGDLETRFKLLNRIARRKADGDHDSNAFDLSPLFEKLKAEAKAPSQEHQTRVAAAPIAVPIASEATQIRHGSEPVETAAAPAASTLLLDQTDVPLRPSGNWIKLTDALASEVFSIISQKAKERGGKVHDLDEDAVYMALHEKADQPPEFAGTGNLYVTNEMKSAVIKRLTDRYCIGEEMQTAVPSVLNSAGGPPLQPQTVISAPDYSWELPPMVGPISKNQEVDDLLDDASEATVATAPEAASSSPSSPPKWPVTRDVWSQPRWLAGFRQKVVKAVSATGGKVHNPMQALNDGVLHSIIIEYTGEDCVLSENGCFDAVQATVEGQLGLSGDPSKEQTPEERHFYENADRVV